MISFQTIVNEIEKHTNLAKNTHNEQQIREQMIAIRALAEVALAEQNSNNPVTNYKFEDHTKIQSIQLNSSTSLPSNRLTEEDGANGSSLFDF